MTAATKQHRTILVVEDEPDIASFLEMALEFEGYQVETARNGQEALTMVQQQPPDVILLDLMLPVVDGWQFLRESRGHPATRGIPIIVVTAVYDAARSPELDGLVILAKPIDVDLLLGLLNDTLSATEGNQMAST
jgi:two-component system, chemotaxis family, chemotaxis protein CheY